MFDAEVPELRSGVPIHVRGDLVTEPVVKLNRQWHREHERRPARKIRIHGHEGDGWSLLLGRIRNRLQKQAGKVVSQEQVEREAARLEGRMWRMKKHPNRDREAWWFAPKRRMKT